jgi:hypothetical protein
LTATYPAPSSDNYGCRRQEQRAFIIDRRGELAIVIMSVKDSIRTAAPPADWLQKTWSGAKRTGVDPFTRDYIPSEDRWAPAPQKGPIAASVTT